MRDELIAAKAEVQAHIHSLRPKVDAARVSAEAASGVRRAYLVSRVASLEAELDALVVEEARLRVEIDRSAR